MATRFRAYSSKAVEFKAWLAAWDREGARCSLVERTCETTMKDDNDSEGAENPEWLHKNDQTNLNKRKEDK